MLGGRRWLCRLKIGVVLGEIPYIVGMTGVWCNIWMIMNFPFWITALLLPFCGLS